MITVLISAIHNREHCCQSDCFFLLRHHRVPAFPDLYTRMHAVGKGDTLALLLCVAGLALYNLFDNFCWYGFVQSVKLMSIAVFWFLASPTATHALLRSAFESGVTPWTKDGTVIIDKTGDG